MIRPMYRVKRDIEQESLVGRHIPDKPRGVAADQFRAIALLGAEGVTVMPVEDSESQMPEIVDRSSVVPDEVRESLLVRVVALGISQMPFPKYASSGVSGPRKHLGQRLHIWRNAEVCPRLDRDALQSVSNRVVARHQGHSGRRANGHRVEPVEFHTLAGNPVDVRGGELRAVEPDILPAHVVRDDDDDVRRFRDRGSRVAGREAGRERKSSGRFRKPPMHCRPMASDRDGRSVFRVRW